MVFHGKPSKACEECRRRRTRCDLSKPSCSQCVRAHRTCPGYREELVIHDESQTLSAKYAATSQQQEDGPSSSKISLAPAVDSTSAFAFSINASRLDRTIEPQDWLSPMILAPSTSAEDQALCFFFGNYVTGSDMLNTCGNYQYLSAIYANQPVGRPLRQAVVAVGLAGLANFWSAPNIMAQANNAYCSALQLVNSRLTNIEEAKSDQSLASILLLSLYEVNNWGGPRSHKSWTQHILGATALVQLRGKKSLESPLGRNIFVHLRNGIIASCIQRHTAVPKSITELTKFSLQYESPVEAASTKLGLLITEHAALRASMKHPQDYESVASIVASLWALDLNYLEWTHNLPPEFDSKEVPAGDDSHFKEVYGNHYLFYSSIWIASIWNNYRCARILANELLRNLASHLLQLTNTPTSGDHEQTSYTNILNTAIKTIHTLADDIFASSPFFLSTTTQGTPRALAGNLILWPLYLASQTSIASDEMRRWAANRLGYIAETMGVQQAVPMVHSLRLTLDIEGLAESVAEISMKEAL